MFESVHRQLREITKAECVADGMLPWFKEVYYSRRHKQIPTRYPYLAFDWGGTSGITWPTGGTVRKLTMKPNRILIAMFARGKQDIDEADAAIERMLWTERTEDVGQYDTGLLPFLDALSQVGIRTPAGDRWAVIPGDEVIVNTIEGLKDTPFCVGAAVMVELVAAGQIITPPLKYVQA